MNIVTVGMTTVMSRYTQQKLEHRRAHALAGDYLEAAGLDDAVLRVEDYRRGEDEDDGEDRRRAYRGEASRALVDQLVNHSRYRVYSDSGSEDGGRSEVRERVEADEQRARDDGGHDERYRYLARYREKPRARYARRLLKRRVHMLESAADLDKYEREQVHAFNDYYAPEAVDVE